MRAEDVVSEHEGDHRMGDLPENVTTVYLGNFSGETARLVAEQLDQRGIAWWYKAPGFLAALWEHGIRMFVDKAHLAEAKEIAKKVSAEREAKGWPPLEE
jgi:hypothetical protein